MAETIRYRVPEAVHRMALDRHHLVEASAGTGKTFLIEHRVVDLVVRGAVPIDSILCVTFTERATAELEQRIRSLLVRVAEASEHSAAAGEPHWRVDDAARERLRDAVLSFDRAAISTIHGFCHRVLGDNAFAGGRLFEEEQVAAESAFTDAFTACLRERFAVEGPLRPYLEAWLDAGKLSSLRGLLWECVQSGGRVSPVFDPEACAAALREAAAILGGVDLDVALKAGYGHTGTRKAVVGRLADVARVARDFAEDGKLPRALGALAALDLAYLRKRAAADPAAQRLVDAALDLARPGSDLACAVATLFLPPILERFRADKRRAGQFDFGDMLTLLWDALDGPAGARLAQRLRLRFPHALIDEFQDTDPVQWQIFRRLYLEAPGPHWLSVIGDPKQAIYGFRGADLHTYLRAREELGAAGGQHTSLAVNFRSTPPLIDAYNHLLTSGEPFFSGGVDYDQPVSAGADLRLVTARGEVPAPVQVFAVGEPGDKIGELRGRLADRIADEIAAILGDAPLRFGKPGSEEPVRASDIYVLTRSVKESTELADVLRARGLPCALYKQEGLLQTTETDEVLKLLGAIANPRSPSARLGAWSTRFFDVALADLGGLRDLDDDDPLVARLYDWHAMAARLDYEQLFARVLSDSRLVERELVLEPSERALTNFLHVFELLLEEVAADRCEIHELAQRLARWQDDLDGLDAAERNLQRLESEDASVQIMTVHKSKGLEAAIVFLAGGLGAFPTRRVRSVHDDGERLAWVGAAPERIEDAISGEGRGDDERLLYVALTRAAGRLYLPYIDPAAFELKGYYRLVNERLAPERVAAAGELFAREILDGATASHAGADRDARALATWRPPAALLAEVTPRDRKKEAARRAGVNVTSYSRLAPAHESELDLGDVVPDDLDLVGDDGPTGDGALPGGRAVGIFLHDLLERMPFSLATEAADADAFAAHADAQKIAESCLCRHGLDLAHRDASLALCYGGLMAPLSLPTGELAGVARADRDLREVEFLYPLRDPHGRERMLVKGFVDLVFEHGGKVYVLDWKSDRLAAFDDASLRDHVAAHYKIQAMLYATAVGRMLGASDEASHEARFGGVVFGFLRGPAVHLLRPSFAALEDFAASLDDGGNS